MQKYFENNAHIKRIKHYLTNCSIGDWYVLYQMSKNLNQRFFAEYLTVLAMTIGLFFFKKHLFFRYIQVSYNKAKGLKFAKEEQRSIGLMPNGLDG